MNTTYLSRIEADKIIDSRDLALRKDELESLRDSLDQAREDRKEIGESAASTQDEIEAADRTVQNAESEFGEDEREELSELENLESEVGEWRHGNTLIREDYFEEYAEQLADDIGAIDRNARWPFNCIDWKEAADQLKADYSEVTYAGYTYFCESR